MSSVRLLPLVVLICASLPARAEDRDADGVTDDMDRCPAQPGFIANMGCPDRDEDGDGLVDRLDRCPTVKGARSTFGCPDVSQPLIASRIAVEQPGTSALPSPAIADKEGEQVRIRGFAVETAEPISFITERSILTDRGETMLLAAARLLASTPRLRRVRIEAYVDLPSLSAARARALSRQRAEVVRRRLSRQGVPAGKLRIVAYGNSRPLDESGSESAREQNNRIELIIE